MEFISVVVFLSVWCFTVPASTQNSKCQEVCWNLITFFFFIYLYSFFFDSKKQNTNSLLM